MFIAEACLLQAVRDKLVTDLTLDEHQCQVELDGMMPDYAGKLFIAVSPGGVQIGPRHKSSGGAIDLVIGVKVTVYNRVTEIARDKRRSTFIQLLTGLAPTLESVVRALDNNYTLTTSALALQAASAVNAGGLYPEPLRQFSPELSARMVMRDPYDAAQMSGMPADPIVAVARSINFSGARYMQVRAS